MADPAVATPGGPAFVVPVTVEEAVTALGAPGAIALAGGTSVGLLVGQRLVEPSRLVWLQRIPSLRGISRRDDRIVIGAGVTLRELAADPLVREELPALVAAAEAVGNTRIRAVATVGGALAHADPRQDLPPVLLAYDAEVEAASAGGRRRLPLRDLATGYLTTSLGDAELVTAVSVPRAPGRRGVYHRFTPGSADDFPTVCVAATVTLERRSVTAARVAVGGAAATAYLVPEAASLVGTEPSGVAVGEVARAAAARAQPADDRLGTPSYKRAMVEVWVERALASCLGLAASRA